jgi:hypothetical protein
VVRDRALTEGTPPIELPPPGEASADRSSDATVPILEVAQGDPVSLRERRLSWAELMMRVFREDVLRCTKCGGRAAVISAITQPEVVEAILTCLGSRFERHLSPLRGRPLLIFIEGAQREPIAFP